MRKLKGAERLIERWKISGTDAMDILDWAEAALYWNAMMVLDPADFALILMGAKSTKEFEKKLRTFIDRKLDLLPGDQRGISREGSK